MADETQQNEQIVQEAKTMGWVPQEQYRGPEGTWLGAKDFVERGRAILPILRSNNERLASEVNTLRTQMTQTQMALQAANASLEALHESHDADVKEQVKDAIEKTKAALAEANKEGDHDAVADLTNKLVELNTASDEAEDRPGKKEKKEQPPQIPPEVLAWYQANPDFVSNPRKIALARAIATEMRQAGEKATGAIFMNMVAAEVDKTLGGKARGTSKVGSDRGSPEGGRSGNGTKSYADLPPEAKAACDKAEKRLVGPTRAHKTVESWRESYVRQYFAE